MPPTYQSAALANQAGFHAFHCLRAAEASAAHTFHFPAPTFARAVEQASWGAQPPG